MVTFHNIDILEDLLSEEFPSSEVAISLSHTASEITKLHVNVIFVDERLIRKLNREFRNKDENTDVLTFDPAFAEFTIDRSIETDLSVGEVYVCPNYIVRQLDDKYGKYSDKRLLEEVYRMIIHGILHLGGWEHTTALDYDNMKDDIEPMFAQQEQLLGKLLNDIGSNIEEDKKTS